MEFVFRPTSTRRELEQILELQQKNLYINVSEEIKEKEGFVTVSHTYDILERMHRVFPHIVAKDGDKVVGYALCMHPIFADDIEVLRPMFAEITSTLPNHTPYMAMGQICIDADYRKKGIFRKLYETMKEMIQPQFSAIVTEVDVKNTRSLSAHYAVGFKDLKTYSSGGQDWKLIILW
ncbi:MAG: GNAT family N-acetyltransferase [Maribacter sp.]|nr:GNAT family N-acetyltransferase [Maribacter sp.]